MRITKIESNGGDGVRIELEKPFQANSYSQIGEAAFVNLNTESNITYSKGFVVSRSNVFRSMDEGGEGTTEELRQELQNARLVAGEVPEASESGNGSSNSLCNQDLITKVKDLEKYFK